MGRILWWVAWTVLGGAAAGQLAARLCQWLVEHPLAIGAESWDISELASFVASDPLAIAPGYAGVFWVGFAVIALVGLGTYDYGGRRREARALKDKEYGEAAWATMADIRLFAHDSLVRKIPVRLPRRWQERRAMAARDPKGFLRGLLGMKEKKPNPVPAWLDDMADDNILLSETCALQLSKIPDPAIERNKHVYILGGSGSGKTFNYVGPNLLQLNSSYVITDPKGDTLKQYGNFFLQNGYTLKVVNTKPDELALSMRYNPLLYITDATSIIQIVNLLIANTTSKEASQGNDFFVKAETQLYMALIGYLHYFWADNPEYRTFNEMVNLLQMAKGDDPQNAVSPLDVIMLGCDGFDDSYVDFVLKKYGGDRARAEASDEWFVIKQYKGFKSTAGSPETEASVIASCNVRMAPFSVGAVKDFFATDETDLRTIGEEKTAFFLIMSDTDSTFNFILAMLLYQLFDINTAIADKNPGSHCTIPINCILDELANIGEIPDLDKKIATLRSRWINLHCILQSATQLKKLYKDNADIIEGNCDTTLFLGRCDPETNKKVSERLGKTTVVVSNRSESHGRQGSWSDAESRIGRDLISAADLGSNPDVFAGDECIVMIKNARPYKDYKYRTFDHPRYRQLRQAGEFDLATWREECAYAARLAEIEAIEEMERSRDAWERQFDGWVMERVA